MVLEREKLDEEGNCYQLYIFKGQELDDRFPVPIDITDKDLKVLGVYSKLSQGKLLDQEIEFHYQSADEFKETFHKVREELSSQIRTLDTGPLEKDNLLLYAKNLGLEEANRMYRVRRWIQSGLFDGRDRIIYGGSSLRERNERR